MAYGREFVGLPEPAPIRARTHIDVLADRVRLLEAFVDHMQTEWLAEDKARLDTMHNVTPSAVATRRAKRRRKRQRLEESLQLPKWRADLERHRTRTSRTGASVQVLAQTTTV